MPRTHVLLVLMVFLVELPPPLQPAPSRNPVTMDSLKADREKAWRDFAGWRVNYDRALILLCGLVMAPQATWSSDRAPEYHPTPMLISKKHKLHADKESA